MNKPLTITCSRCGAANALDRVFCFQCGNHLDLLKAEHLLQHGGGRWNKRVIRLIEIALLAVLALLLWPVPPDGKTGGEADYRQCTLQLQALLDAQRAGRSQSQVFTESEMNAYLSRVLEQRQRMASAEGLQMTLASVKLIILKDMVRVQMLTRFGVVRLSYEIVGRPVLENGVFTFRTEQARWGHLPAPGPLKNWVAGRMAPVFLGMELERQVVDNVKRLDLAEGRVRAIVEAASSPEPR